MPLGTVTRAVGYEWERRIFLDERYRWHDICASGSFGRFRSAALVYQVDRTGGIVTISPIDITTASGLAADCHKRGERHAGEGIRSAASRWQHQGLRFVLLHRREAYVVEGLKRKKVRADRWRGPFYFWRLDFQVYFGGGVEVPGVELIFSIGNVALKSRF